MSTWKFFRLLLGGAALASLGVLSSFCEASQQGPVYRIAVGDSADQVRQLLGVIAQPGPTGSTRPGTQPLMLKDRGVTVFFDGVKVHRIRLDAPFSGPIFGARIGERRQEILAALGPPERTLPWQAVPGGGVAYIYTFNSNASARYDFGRDDRLQTVFVFSGSIEIPFAAGITADAKPEVPNQPRITEGHQRIATGLQAAGQLTATHDLGCIPIERVKPTYTAADLYRATRQCLDKDQFALSAPLFWLGGIYGRFDIARIADKTVGGGVSILIMNVGDGLTDDQKRGFKAALDVVHDDPQRHAWFCAQVAAIGPPQYVPVYLIVHGLGLRGNEKSDRNGLDPDFDAPQSWSKLLHDGVRCSAN